MSMVFGVVVLFVVEQGHAEAKQARFRLSATEALYESYGELEKARLLIREAGYDGTGRNSVIQNALLQPGRRIPGTRVILDPLPGDASGAWYSMTARVPYETHYERIVTQPVREYDYFSSYLLFVDKHPAGISGQPLGSIHTNRSIQFFFPGGIYRYPISAVEGAEFHAGATLDNTELSERFNPAADPVALDSALGELGGAGFDEIAEQVTSDFNFADPGLDVALELFVKDGSQWVKAETWTRAVVQDKIQDVVVGYKDVNPHDVTITKTTQVSAGFEERTRDVQVLDHYETVTETKEVPVYEDATRTVDVPVYKFVEDTVDVPVYKTATRTVLKQAWIPLDDSSGGTTVGGDGEDANLGYWGYKEVEETYTTTEVDHYEKKTVTKKVFDYMDQKTETYRQLTGYETISYPVEKPVYRTETETYTVEIFDDVDSTETITVYDKEPIYEQKTVKEKIAPKKIATVSMPAPENGLIRVAGNIRSLKGKVIGRLTIASEGQIKITNNILYRDEKDRRAFVNGDKPWLPYEPNPDYQGSAALGLLAQNDILYTRDVPDNFEVNATMASITGRVGIDGVVLDDDGEIVAENKIYNDYGEDINRTFRKNSIRRLGGITTAKRPVETVVRNGSITAGFNVGRAVFDQNMVANPPPNFLSVEKPRFFSMSIVR